MFFAINQFRNVISRNTSRRVRAFLRLHAECNIDQALVSPLRYSRFIQDHFWRSRANLAVLKRIMSFDKNPIKCEGRHSARTFMKGKVLMFCIRLYANMCWKPLYFRTQFQTIDLRIRLFSIQESRTSKRFATCAVFSCSVCTRSHLRRAAHQR